MGEAEWLVEGDGVEPLPAEWEAASANSFLSVSSRVSIRSVWVVSHMSWHRSCWDLTAGGGLPWSEGEMFMKASMCRSPASFEAAKAWGATLRWDSTPRPPRRSGRERMASSSSCLSPCR